MNKQSTLQLDNGRLESQVKKIGDSHPAKLKKKEEEFQSKVNHLQQKHAET
jgi:hypothetical protein